jgi:hypothetical protein
VGTGDKNGAVEGAGSYCHFEQRSHEPNSQVKRITLAAVLRKVYGSKGDLPYKQEVILSRSRMVVGNNKK